MGSGGSSLHTAATAGDEDAARDLIEATGDDTEALADLVGAVDNKRRTPLHLAVDGSHMAVVRLLLGHSAPVNAGDKVRTLSCAILRL